MATKTYGQLTGGDYTWPASILPLTSMDEYRGEHRTARKRASRSARLGYHAELIERADHTDDIYRVNTSMPERQGRPMTAGYTEPPAFSRLPVYECDRHRVDQWGVLKDSTLVGYLIMYVVGDLAMVSQILGHADHLANDIMYQLTLTAFAALPLPITVFYNRHDSGTDGLRYFKERLGFSPQRVEWVLK